VTVLSQTWGNVPQRPSIQVRPPQKTPFHPAAQNKFLVFDGAELPFQPPVLVPGG